MRAFLGSLKGKIITGVASVGVIAAVVIAIVLSKQGYRSIVVKEMNGSVTVVNDNKSSEAFLGQKLVDGDEITVAPAANLMLLLDSDKYIYAEENSHFWIDAKGKKGNTRTTIRQDAGTNLYEIDNKLKSSEYYDVNTSNATLSVRGTVFRVECKTEGADAYTIVEVFEGEVYVEAIMEDGTSTGENRTLKSGEMAVIHSNASISEFLVGESGEVINQIEYSKIPQETAYILGGIIDKGRPLCISKELLFDVVGITEHRFIATEEIVEATCTEDGYTIYICEICGEEIKEDIVPAKKHTYGKWEIVKEPTEDEKGQKVATCEVCGYELVEAIEFGDDVSDTTAPVDNDNYGGTKPGEVVKPGGTDIPANTPGSTPETPNTTAPSNTTEASGTTESTGTTEIPSTSANACANGHSFVERTVEATCTKEGSVTQICSVCGEQGTVTTIPKKSHKYVSSTTAPTCTTAGNTTQTCSVCGAQGNVTNIPALGHDYSVTVRVDVVATCSAEGSKTVKCSRCTSTITKSIPKDSSNHNLRTATYVDDSKHSYTCGWCHEVINKTHSSTLKPYPGNESIGHVNVCSECGAVFESSFDQHNVVWITTATTHKQMCSVCGLIYTPESNHTSFEPGTHIGTCSTCGASDVTVVGP